MASAGIFFILITPNSSNRVSIVDVILVIVLVLYCKELLLLPIDQLPGRKTIECRFIDCIDIDKYPAVAHRGFAFCSFETEREHILLKFPISCPIEDITEKVFPPKNKTITITYYRLSKLLCSWSVVEDE